ncbi:MULTISPECIES: tail fiber domain-containing protein [unclassified Leclercia]|uniref:tail fiber domain-containing protein n=1 Tax=unclassified Leclercia TaxID=2627398 RepID=UPI0025B8C21E|nr:MULTISPECIES: tail fiber domain-containing protein [unclassified Leclercia]
MTTYATNNPLGSMDPKDLFDNAQNLDFALNYITRAIWKDRFGRDRKTYWGMEQEFSNQLLTQQLRFNHFIQNSGYQVIGEYTAGPLTVTDYNQLIRYQNELYKLTADTAIPYTTTGNDAASWANDSSHFINVGDAALRQELSQPGGSSLIGGIEITAESFGVVSGLVSITVAKSNADKIMQKAAEIYAAGGGKIIFTKSLYQVHMDEADYDPSNENFRVAALKIPYDNVILCGQGWFTTTIQAWATNSAYEVIQWTKSPLENGVTKVTGVGLHDICIDGNYHGDYTPGSYLRQCAAVRGAGIKGLSISRLRVINTSHYGMGLQNGGYIGCVIDGYLAENTGADGIDIKDNEGVSRAFKLNNIIVRNFGQLDEPEHPWAGLDVMSFAPEISNVYISDFGDKGAIDAGFRLKNGTEGQSGTRGTGGIFANVSNITVIQNRFKATPSVTIGVDIRACNVNYANIVVRGTAAGRIGGGISLEERYCQGVNVQISKVITAYSATNGSNGNDRNYGDAEGCSVTNMSVVDATTAVVTTRKHQRFTSLTLKDCTNGLTSNGANAGPVTVIGLYLENVTNPFGGLATNQNVISGIHGPGSTNFQAGLGTFKDSSGNWAATTVLSKNGVRLYVNSTEVSAGTEIARFGPTSSSILAPLIITGSVTPAAGNTYNVGSSSAPWAGGYTQTTFTVTSDERQKSRPVMLARGSLDFVVTSDERLMQMPYADDILDAWAEVDFVQFQFIDRIEAKGDDGARWHVGIIAQRAQEAFMRHGLDPRRFAFFCYDPEETIPAVYESVAPVYERVPAVYDGDGREVSPELWHIKEPAHEKMVAESYVVGERYGIRYEEALVMEAALHRRNHQRLLTQLEALTNRVVDLETK